MGIKRWWLVLLVAATLAEEAEDYSYPEIRMSAAAPVREGTRRLAASDDVLTSYTVFLTHAPRENCVADPPCHACDGADPTMCEWPYSTWESASVEVTVTPGSTAELEIVAPPPPHRLIFTALNWHVEQTVVVRAPRDFVDRGSSYIAAVFHTAASADSRYDGARARFVADDARAGEDAVSILVRDADSASVGVAGELAVNERTGVVEYSVVLGSRPRAPVTVSAAAMEGDRLDIVGGGTVTFDPETWDTPRSLHLRTKPRAAHDAGWAHLSDWHLTGVLHAVHSEDVAYNSGPVGHGAELAVNISSADPEAYVLFADVDEVPPALQLTEGQNATYRVRLRRQPAANVTIAIASTNTLLLVVSPRTLHFDEENWAAYQAVLLTARNDDVDRGAAYRVEVRHGATSFDPRYAAKTVRFFPPNEGKLSIEVLDDDESGIVVATVPFNAASAAASSTVTITEGEDAARYPVVLNARPAHPIVVGLTPVRTQSGAFLVASPSVLVFNPSSWDVPQYVHVRGVRDAAVRSSRVAVLQHAARTGVRFTSAAHAVVRVHSLDTAALLTSAFPDAETAATRPSVVLTEGSGAGFLSIVLASLPLHTVAVSVESYSPRVAHLSSRVVRFTSMNWDQPQRVALSAVHDPVRQRISNAPIRVSLASSANEYARDKVAIVPRSDLRIGLRDNDVAAVALIVPMSGLRLTEGGASCTVPVALSSRPTHDVTVSVVVESTSHLFILEGASLLFTPETWDAVQSVRVRALVDHAETASLHYTLFVLAQSEDAFYNLVNRTIGPINGGDEWGETTRSPGTSHHLFVPSTVNTEVINVDRAHVVVGYEFGSPQVEQNGQSWSHSLSLSSIPKAPVTIRIATSPYMRVFASARDSVAQTWTNPHATVPSGAFNVVSLYDDEVTLRIDPLNWNVKHVITYVAKKFDKAVVSAENMSDISVVNPIGPSGFETRSVIPALSRFTVTSEDYFFVRSYDLEGIEMPIIRAPIVDAIYPAVNISARNEDGSSSRLVVHAPPMYHGPGLSGKEDIGLPGVIAIYGRNFGTTPGIIARFSNQPCIETLWINSTLVLCRLPFGALSGGDVALELDGSQRTLHENDKDAVSTLELDSPLVFAVDPVLLITQGGGRLRIIGANFGVHQSRLEGVWVGPYTCVDPRLLSDSQIVCLSPPGMGIDWPITVRIRGAVNNEVNRNSTVVSYAPPAITSVRGCAVDDGAPSTSTWGCPTSGGTRIQIMGSNFGPAGAVVTVSGRNCPVVQQTHGSLQCELPSGVGAGVEMLVSQFNGRVSSPVYLLSYAPPEVHSVSPNRTSAGGGGWISIHGQNFGPRDLLSNATSAGVGTLSCEHLVWVSHEQLDCRVPSGKGAKLDVNVRVSNQHTAANRKFSYTPYVHGLSRSDGPRQQGYHIRVYGRGFLPVGDTLLCRFECAKYPPPPTPSPTLSPTIAPTTPRPTPSPTFSFTPMCDPFDFMAKEDIADGALVVTGDIGQQDVLAIPLATERKTVPTSAYEPGGPYHGINSAADPAYFSNAWEADSSTVYPKDYAHSYDPRGTMMSHAGSNYTSSSEIFSTLGHKTIIRRACGFLIETEGTDTLVLNVTRWDVAFDSELTVWSDAPGTKGARLLLRLLGTQSKLTGEFQEANNNMRSLMKDSKFGGSWSSSVVSTYGEGSMDELILTGPYAGERMPVIAAYRSVNDVYHDGATPTALEMKTRNRLWVKWYSGSQESNGFRAEWSTVASAKKRVDTICMHGVYRIGDGAGSKCSVEERNTFGCVERPNMTIGRFVSHQNFNRSGSYAEQPGPYEGGLPGLGTCSRGPSGTDCASCITALITNPSIKTELMVLSLDWFDLGAGDALIFQQGVTRYTDSFQGSYEGWEEWSVLSDQQKTLTMSPLGPRGYNNYRWIRETSLSAVRIRWEGRADNGTGFSLNWERVDVSLSTAQPTAAPTASPTPATFAPTFAPTVVPTVAPTLAPAVASGGTRRRRQLLESASRSGDHRVAYLDSGQAAPFTPFVTALECATRDTERVHYMTSGLLVSPSPAALLRNATEKHCSCGTIVDTGDSVTQLDVHIFATAWALNDWLTIYEGSPNNSGIAIATFNASFAASGSRLTLFARHGGFVARSRMTYPGGQWSLSWSPVVSNANHTMLVRSSHRRRLLVRSPSPTPLPTLAPTVEPTPFPTTTPPTPDPTPGPTFDAHFPTLSPTPLPTESPTTPGPTFQPTPSPVHDAGFDICDFAAMHASSLITRGAMVSHSRWKVGEPYSTSPSCPHCVGTADAGNDACITTVYIRVPVGYRIVIAFDASEFDVDPSADHAVGTPDFLSIRSAGAVAHASDVVELTSPPPLTEEETYLGTGETVEAKLFASLQGAGSTAFAVLDDTWHLKPHLNFTSTGNVVEVSWKVNNRASTLSKGWRLHWNAVASTESAVCDAEVHYRPTGTLISHRGFIGNNFKPSEVASHQWILGKESESCDATCNLFSGTCNAAGQNLITADDDYARSAVNSAKEYTPDFVINADPAFWDADGDGLLDLIVSNVVGTVQIFVNDGDGNYDVENVELAKAIFGSVNVTNGIMLFLKCDVNDAACDDLVVEDGVCDGAAFRDGAPATLAQCQTLTMADILIIGTESGHLRTWVRPLGSVGVVASFVELTRSTFAPNGLKYAFNPYGLLDVGSHAAPTLWTHTYDFGGTAQSVTYLVVGNGIGELVVWTNKRGAGGWKQREETITVLMGNIFGVGLFTTPKAVIPLFADMNGDNHQDLVAVSPSGEIKVFLRVVSVAFDRQFFVNSFKDPAVQAEDPSTPGSFLPTFDFVFTSFTDSRYVIVACSYGPSCSAGDLVSGDRLGRLQKWMKTMVEEPTTHWTVTFVEVSGAFLSDTRFEGFEAHAVPVDRWSPLNATCSRWIKGSSWGVFPSYSPLHEVCYFRNPPNEGTSTCSDWSSSMRRLCSCDYKLNMVQNNAIVRAASRYTACRENNYDIILAGGTPRPLCLDYTPCRTRIEAPPTYTIRLEISFFDSRNYTTGLQTDLFGNINTLIVEADTLRVGETLSFNASDNAPYERGVALTPDIWLDKPHASVIIDSSDPVLLLEWNTYGGSPGLLEEEGLGWRADWNFVVIPTPAPTFNPYDVCDGMGQGFVDHPCTEDNPCKLQSHAKFDLDAALAAITETTNFTFPNASFVPAAQAYPVGTKCSRFINASHLAGTNESGMTVARFTYFDTMAEHTVSVFDQAPFVSEPAPLAVYTSACYPFDGQAKYIAARGIVASASTWTYRSTQGAKFVKSVWLKIQDQASAHTVYTFENDGVVSYKVPIDVGNASHPIILDECSNTITAANNDGEVYAMQFNIYVFRDFGHSCPLRRVDGVGTACVPANEELIVHAKSHDLDPFTEVLTHLKGCTNALCGAQYPPADYVYDVVNNATLRKGSVAALWNTTARWNHAELGEIAITWRTAKRMQATFEELTWALEWERGPRKNRPLPTRAPTAARENIALTKMNGKWSHNSSFSGNMMHSNYPYGDVYARENFNGANITGSDPRTIMFPSMVDTIFVEWDTTFDYSYLGEAAYRRGWQLEFWQVTSPTPAPTVFAPEFETLAPTPMPTALPTPFPTFLWVPDLETTATYISENEVACVPPDYDVIRACESEDIKVEISVDAIHWGADGVNNVFHFTESTDAPITLNYEPKYGPIHQSTFVRVTGAGLSPSDQCAMGKHSIKTMYIDASMIVCVMPPLDLNSTESYGNYTHVLYVGYMRVGTFDFYNQPAVISVAPSSGLEFGCPHSRRGRSEWLWGSASAAFRAGDSAEENACPGVRVFTSMPRTTELPLVLEVNTVQCRFGMLAATAHAVRRVNCDASLRSDVSSPTEFTATRDTVGSHFVKDCLEVKCAPPPAQMFPEFNFEGLLTFNVSVTVSLDAGRSYADSDVSYMYYRSCPHGMYCPIMTSDDRTLTFKKCEAGHFCASEGSRRQIPCPPGTYQPLPGQGSCQPCRSGTYCGEEGTDGINIKPTKCPAGWVCDKDFSQGFDQFDRPTPLSDIVTMNMGLRTRSTICPEGSYCLSGTSRFIDTRDGDACFANNTFVSGYSNTTAATTNASLSNSNWLNASYSNVSMSSISSMFNPWLPIYAEAELFILESHSFKARHSTTYIAGHENVITPCQCEMGFYCKAGTTTREKVVTEIGFTYGKQNICFGGFQCAAGSIFPQGQDQCPIGSYCVGIDVFPCPVGHSCPDYGLDEPHVCQSGSYQNKTGSDSCPLCPLGHYCPKDNLIDPILCKPGYTCHEIGLVQSGIRCPRGHFCAEGSSSSDTYVCSVAHQLNASGAPRGATLCANVTDPLYNSSQGGSTILSFCLGGAHHGERCLDNTLCEADSSELELEKFGCRTFPWSKMQCVTGRCLAEKRCSKYAHNSTIGNVCRNEVDCMQSVCTAPLECPPGVYCLSGIVAKKIALKPEFTGLSLLDPVREVGRQASIGGSYLRCYQRNVAPNFLGDTTYLENYACIPPICRIVTHKASGSLVVQICNTVQLSANNFPAPCTQGSFCPRGTGTASASRCPRGSFCPNIRSLIVAKDKAAEANTRYVGTLFPSMIECGRQPCMSIEDLREEGLCTSVSDCSARAKLLNNSNSTAMKLVGPFDVSNTTHVCARGSRKLLSCMDDTDCPASVQALTPECFQVFATDVPVPARAGYHVPVFGATTDLKCTPGKYASDAGFPECPLCPAGQYCPSAGLMEPKICTIGYICGVGLVIPQVRCPKGHYCVEGVGTSFQGPKQVTSLRVMDPQNPSMFLFDLSNATGPFAEGCPTPDATYAAFGFYCPVFCRAGVYCISGVGYDVGVNQLNDATADNILYPKICTEGYFCGRGSENYMGTGQCAKGTYCPAGSHAAQPAPKGNYVPTDGANRVFPCPKGRFAGQEAMSVCYGCEAGTYQAFTGQAACIECGMGKYLEAEDAKTRGFSCDDCPPGKFANSFGGKSLDSCLDIPAGFICQLSGLGHNPSINWTTSDQVALSCLKCPTGYLCPAGSSSFANAEGCPDGYFCNTAATSENIIANEPGSEVNAGICPRGFYCPIGTSWSTKQACARKYFCPPGVGSIRPDCAPGTTSDTLAGYPFDCLPSFAWLRLRQNGFRVISISPGTSSTQLLDPMAYDQNLGVWRSPPVFSADEVALSFNLETFETLRLKLNFSRATKLGLVYGDDYRVAIHSKLEAKGKEVELPLPDVEITQAMNDLVEADIAQLILNNPEDLVGMKADVQVCHFCLNGGIVTDATYETTVNGTFVPGFNGTVPVTVRSSTGSDGESKLFAKTWSHDNNDMRYLYRSEIFSYIREPGRKELYFRCLAFCEEAKLPTLMKGDDDLVGYGMTDDRYVQTTNRYPMPKSFKRVNASLASVTYSAQAALQETGMLELGFIARANQEVVVQIEILNGTLYSRAFEIFGGSASLNDPEVAVYGKPQKPPGASYVALLKQKSKFNLPLNLHNFFDHTNTKRTQGDAAYTTISEDIFPYPDVPSGAHILLLQYLRNWGPEKDYPEGSNFKELRESGNSTYVAPVGDPVLPSDVDNIEWDLNLFWSSKSVASLPYVPYVSNCAGYDSYIPIFQLFEHPSCTSANADSEPVLAYNPLSDGNRLDADFCDIVIDCILEEDPAVATSKTSYSWFLAQVEDFLFFFTRSPISKDIFAGYSANSGVEVEKSSNELMDPTTETDLWSDWESVPVVVNSACVEVDREMKNVGVAVPNPTNKPDLSYPTRVHLVVAYWHRDGAKLLSTARIYMCDFETSRLKEMDDNGMKRLPYKFEFTLYPESYFLLLQEFTLSFEIYIMASFFLGAALCVTIIFVFWPWAICCDANLPRRKLGVRRYITGQSLVALRGSFYVILPSMVVLVVLAILFMQTIGPSRFKITGLGGYIFFNFNGNVEEKVMLTTSVRNAYKGGRIGFALAIIGFYYLISGANKIVETFPAKKTALGRMRHANSTMMKNRIILILSLFTAAEAFFVILSRTKAFAQQVTLFTLLIKVLENVFKKLVIEKYLPEVMVQAPFMIVSQVVIRTMSLGTAQFVAFAQTYLMLVGVQVVQRIVVPMVLRIVERIVKPTVAKIMAKIKPPDEDAEIPAPPPGTKEFQQDIIAIDDIAKGANLFLSQVFSVPFYLFVLIFVEQLSIKAFYGNRDVEVAVIFGFLMVMAQLIIDVFVQNILESVYEWRLTDYIDKAKVRFQERSTEWVLETQLQTLDAVNYAYFEIPMYLQRRKLHHFCFSDQYYFILGVMTWGLLLAIYGAFILVMRYQDENVFYAPWLDLPWNAPIAAYAISISVLVAGLFKKIARFRGIWVLNTDSNEAVAAKKKKVDEEVDAVDIRYPHLEHAIETEADPPISRAEIRNVFLNRESPPYTKCSISLSENEFQTHTPSHLLYSFLDSLNRSSRSPR